MGNENYSANNNLSIHHVFFDMNARQWIGMEDYLPEIATIVGLSELYLIKWSPFLKVLQV